MPCLVSRLIFLKSELIGSKVHKEHFQALVDLMEYKEGPSQLHILPSLCKPKREGGLGIRTMCQVNQTLNGCRDWERRIAFGSRSWRQNMGWLVFGTFRLKTLVSWVILAREIFSSYQISSRQRWQDLILVGYMGGWQSIASNFSLLFWCAVNWFVMVNNYLQGLGVGLFSPHFSKKPYKGRAESVIAHCFLSSVYSPFQRKDLAVDKYLWWQFLGCLSILGLIGYLLIVYSSPLDCIWSFKASPRSLSFCMDSYEES